MDFTKIVVKYAFDDLISILSEKSEAYKELILSKYHSIYWKNYFIAIKAKTIIIEENYIDRAFLEDFSNYYIRCFSDYKRKTTRLHFFKINIEPDDFKKYLEGKQTSLNEKKLNKSYLGFLVVKPLPNTIIGRTCLKTYPSNKNKRVFPAIRKYEVNLFGTLLSLDSLAFQEQDLVVSKCATSALWSMFQKTGIKFQHYIPSPSEITKIATEKMPLLNRIFPNEGLFPYQICHAIREIGLEAIDIVPSDIIELKSTIYAYLHFQIPLLLGITIYEEDQNDGEWKSKGLHAVTLTGYSYDQNQTNNLGNNLNIVADNINKIYVHDDQVGPFARMEFDNVTIPIVIRDIIKDTAGNMLIEPELFECETLSTSWGNGRMRAMPNNLIVPLYHKIRIPFKIIYDTILAFNKLLCVITPTQKYDLKWDIYLTDIKNFRSDLVSEGIITSNYRRKVLMTSMPKFLWCAKARYMKKPIINFVFDATDIEQGNFLNFVVEYNRDFAKALRIIFKNSSLLQIYKICPFWKIINYFADEINSNSNI